MSLFTLIEMSCLQVAAIRRCNESTPIPSINLDRRGFALEHWRKQATSAIVDSLRPGQPESLRVKPDGRIMNGNTRIKVLEERGYDIESLPREAAP
jgi:hypothetical protein